MGRPRKFDRGGALDLAVEVFWENGYECTSVQDLVRRLGIHRASLYDTYGSKYNLFCEALDRYSKRVIEDWLAPLRDKGDTRDVLQRFFDQLIEAQCAGKVHPCLVVKTALAPIHEDARTHAQLREHVDKVKDWFTWVLLRGQKRGEIRADEDARSLARYLVTVLQGLIVSAAIDSDPQDLRDTLRASMAWIAPPAEATKPVTAHGWSP